MMFSGATINRYHRNQQKSPGNHRITVNSVPHKRLILKSERLGITGNLLRWIKTFLSERKQTVVLNGISSDWTDVISGVPQGSVLSPVLFILYVNDLPDKVKSCTPLYCLIWLG